MVDHLTPEERSRNMSRVPNRNTGPEIIVRKLCHALGFRFRLHSRHLPGSPDLVFPRLRSAVFVHGCFWHRHKGCRRASVPASRRDYWMAKFDRNVARDRKAIRDLRKMGWRVLVVWECQTKKTTTISNKIKRFLSQ
ncbi:MAG: DNA mismatch endonuclease Vsr [Rhodospirillaceae bacterium]|nr:DNA mismatch endonuclease Vsr [Rhodospirillaceae bacterium]